MKSKLFGWLIFAAIVAGVMAIVFRVSFLRNLVIGVAPAPSN